jgi:hypothetical protein
VHSGEGERYVRNPGRLMQTIDRPFPIPQAKVMISAAAKKVVGKITLLAARAPQIDLAVHGGAYGDTPRAAAACGGRIARFDMRPLVTRHIARVFQMTAVVSRADHIRSTSSAPLVIRARFP